MEQLPQKLRLRQDSSQLIECWDDDEDLQCMDGLQIRIASRLHSRTNSIASSSGRLFHRDSVSSRRSFPSDSQNDDSFGDWNDLDDGALSLLNSQAPSVQAADVPMSANVPTSALRGGTIRKLGSLKERAAQVEDWADGLDLSATNGDLRLKLHHAAPFPDAPPSPTKSSANRSPDIPHFLPDKRGTQLTPPSETLHYRNESEEHGDATVKLSNFAGLMQKAQETITSIKQCAPNTGTGSTFLDPATCPDSLTEPNEQGCVQGFDEGAGFNDSVPGGLKHGELRQDHWSKDVRTDNGRNSSALQSSSLSSLFTANSEDDDLSGLILPDNPSALSLALRQRLDKQRSRQPSPSPANSRSSVAQSPKPSEDDFFSGIETGDGDLIRAPRLTLNKNVRRKEPVDTTERPTSNVTAGQKPTSALSTRIPRPCFHHDRSHSAQILPATNLEPVAENGAPLSNFKRSSSQLGSRALGPGSSSSTIPKLVNTMQTEPVASNRRRIGISASSDRVRSGSRSPSLCYLHLRKPRSTVRGMASCTSSIAPRPYARQCKGSRSIPANRSRAPVDRAGAEPKTCALCHSSSVRSGSLSRQPSNSSLTQTSRMPRPLNKRDMGDMASDVRSSSRSSIPIGHTGRTKETQSSTQLPMAGPARRGTSHSSHRRNFGDGSELEAFDDLPTSVHTESKFMKNPTRRPPQQSLRIKVEDQRTTSSTTQATEPRVSSPARTDFRPRFARDTKASRNARQQRLAMTTARERLREHAPLAPTTANFRLQTRQTSSPTPEPKQLKKTDGRQPHLIRPLGSGVRESRCVKGMRYNPTLYRWEGNENEVAGFDMLHPPPSPKAAPALIAKIEPTAGVQIVNEMKFDPQRMCWVRLSRQHNGEEGVAIPPEEEEDPFAGLPDLEDKPKRHVSCQDMQDKAPANLSDGHDKSGDELDDWPITEEFDVGPEFIRRQRVEEEKWRRKVGRWIREEQLQDDNSWKWAIRNLVKNGAAQSFATPTHRG